MNDQRHPHSPGSAAPRDKRARRTPRAWVGLRDALVEAQARRIQELEHRLAERSRVLTDAAEALAAEIRRREQAQAVLFEAQKLETVGHLAGGLTHDLRNLMGVIALGYQILIKTTSDAGILDVARRGGRALGQAQRLIENLLNLMRRRDSQTEVIAPDDWLAQMQDLLGYAVGRRATCRTQVADATWPVRVEEPRLGAALINLVVNARDASPEGGEIVVAVRNLPQGAARPAGVPDGDFVVFSVIDAGCGMTAQVLAQATRPLFSTKAPGQGTGLGLSMVQGFALASAGHLVITSTPGEGTQVDLYLPRSTETEASAAVDPVSANPAAVGTIMLVDDDDLIRASLAGVLREGGYEVVESSSAEVALALLHTLPRLALVVADVVLPGLDGPALVQRLRLERPDLPALLITGYSPFESPLAGVPVLTKPIERRHLEGAVLAALRRPRAPTQTQAAILDRLIVRLRSPELLAALLAWRKARGRALLPTLDAVQGIPPSLSDRMFIAFRETEAPDFGFRYLSVGAALVELLGRSLHGEPVATADADMVGTLAAAYERAARTGLPSYEYARYSLGDGPPVRFERLILPVSRDGEHVSQLIGIVQFVDLTPTATGIPSA